MSTFANSISIMNRIKVVLKSQGRSQKWLSDQLGVSTGSLSLLEKFTLSDPFHSL